MAKKVVEEDLAPEEKTSIFLLFDEIDNEVAKSVCEWILSNNFSATNKPDMLNLMINSPGGSLSDAFAIIDIMQSSKIPVRTIGLGEIQSAGLMIFLAGTPGERILTPNTSIMSHSYSWGSRGKHHELIAASKEFSLTYDRMLNHYKNHTKLSIGDIKKHLLPEHDVYLSAEEALKFKICDKIAVL